MKKLTSTKKQHETEEMGNRENTHKTNVYYTIINNNKYSQYYLP
jgi:hypothetical protein